MATRSVDFFYTQCAINSHKIYAGQYCETFKCPPKQNKHPYFTRLISVHPWNNTRKKNSFFFTITFPYKNHIFLSQFFFYPVLAKVCARMDNHFLYSLLIFIFFLTLNHGVPLSLMKTCLDHTFIIS